MRYSPEVYEACARVRAALEREVTLDEWEDEHGRYCWSMSEPRLLELHALMGRERK